MKAIKTKFNEEKAVVVAAYLVKIQGGKCDKYWLNKVMYYIERESLIKNGQPVFFDKLFSAPYGPIASAVNDGIDLTAYPADSLWNQYFSLNNNIISLHKEVDYSVLSAFEVELIKNAFEKFKGWDFTKLHNFFHNLPEHKETKSREDISYSEILRAAGYSPEAIKETLEEISYINNLESTLHCAA